MIELSDRGRRRFRGLSGTVKGGKRKEMLPLRETAGDWRFARENRLGRGGGGGRRAFGGAERPVDCAGGGGGRARAKKLLVCMEVPAHNEMGTALRTIIFSSVFFIQDCFPLL